MSDQNTMFAGWEDFGSEESTAGMAKVQFGLSVDTVQLVGEGHQKLDGLNPVELAKQFAATFNMPVEGLRVFVDGEEVSFTEDTVIPDTAQSVVYRDPATEKGAPVLLPMDDSETMTVHVAAVDQHLVVRRWSEDQGTMVFTGLVSLAFEFNPQAACIFEGLREERIESGLRFWADHQETIRLTETPRLLRDAKMVVEDGVGTCDLIEAQGEDIVALILNGKQIDLGSNEPLGRGDTLIIMVKGLVTEEDFEAWSEDQYQNANGAITAAQYDRDDAIEERARELAAMTWSRLRIEAAKKKYGGLIKLAGAGRTKEVIMAEILETDLPKLDEEAVYNAYLEEFAPELLAEETEDEEDDQ